MNKDAELLTSADVHAVLDSFGRSNTGVRNRALVTILWRSGLRCAEALSLLLRDINPEARTIRVRQGKGGKSRTVPIDSGCLTVLEYWLLVRRGLAFNSQVIFCTLDRGRPISTTYVRRIVRNSARKAGIYRRIHPHAFRHLFAVELDDERTPMRVISELLGHARMTTTNTYLNHHSPRQTAETIAKRPKWLEDITE